MVTVTVPATVPAMEVVSVPHGLPAAPAMVPLTTMVSPSGRVLSQPWASWPWVSWSSVSPTSVQGGIFPDGSSRVPLFLSSSKRTVPRVDVRKSRETS